jgi:hypothetical protein
MIFVYSLMKPYYGRNSSRLQSFAAHPNNVELAWRHLLPVPGSIAAQVNGTCALGLLDKPQRTGRGHKQTKGVDANDTPPLATLILAQTIKRLTITDIDFHRPAVAIVRQDVVYAEREVSREKGFNQGPWFSLARRLRLFASLATDYDDANGPPRQDTVPKRYPGLHLRLGF